MVPVVIALALLSRSVVFLMLPETESTITLPLKVAELSALSTIVPPPAAVSGRCR